MTLNTITTEAFKICYMGCFSDLTDQLRNFVQNKREQEVGVVEGKSNPEDLERWGHECH